MNVHFDMHRLSAAAIASLLLSCFALSASAQQTNPNNLPPCSSFEKIWHDCWGADIFNGNEYVGEFKYHKKNGQGTYTHANGAKYVGEFKGGKQLGQGTYTYGNGEKYVGEVKDGKQHGQGTYSFRNGDKYVGEFKDDKMHGQGTFTFSSGDEYVGGFKDGTYHGQGVRTKNGGNRQEGIWKNGNFIVDAKVDLPNLNNDVSTNTDRIDITRERQQLAEERPNYESQKNENDLNYEIFAIKPQFYWVGAFKDGLAPFRVGDDGASKYGFIDRQGKVAIIPQFDAADIFSDELAPVLIGDQKTGKWGFINRDGKFVIQPNFDWVGRMHEGLINVRIGDVEKGKWGFIDKYGAFVIKPQYKSASEFHDGIAVVVTSNQKHGFIDKKGKFLIKPKFDFADNFQEGLASVIDGKTGKHGFVDKKGKVVIDFLFDQTQYFSEGLASVRVGNEKTGKWGFIDRKGKFVINPQFDWARDFQEGLALVFVRDNKTGKFGFIDKQGMFVISPQFDGAYSFREGFASVRVGDDRTGKWGFIDKEGKFFVKPQFDNNDLFSNINFSEGFAVSCIKESGTRQCGFVSKESSQIFALAESQQRQISRADDKRQFTNLTLKLTNTNPDSNGVVILTINTNSDTASLLINSEEQGGRADGNYVIKKVARVGQDTQFKITATDINGNSDTKTITVTRQASPSSTTQTAILKPETINRSKPRDAVAIIIGIQNYKRVPRAEFANNDAREFNEYAIRALGIKPEKIKMLLDEEADEVNIVKAFENWLPIQVNKDKTDVYVFYSGHGLPAPDGKSLYFLPHGVDKELLSRTAVSQNEIVAALTAAKPKSVTMFIDACYSGQTRGGDVLVANAKPVALKADKNAYPANFTVITASANDQISSSSSDLKHGIFSFYLMKGMEGEADANQDGKITLGEMQDYLSDKVTRQATTLGRKQNTQLVGDSSRVLVMK